MTDKGHEEDPEATQVVPVNRFDTVAEEEVLPSNRRLRVILYSVLVALTCAVALVMMISNGWYLDPEGSLDTLTDDLRRYVLSTTLFSMLIAGGAGGALANLRDFLRLGQRSDGVPVRLEVPLYLKPLCGALVGLFTFYIVSYFIAVLSIGSTTQGWALLHGRLAYTTLALLSGYCVQDALERLMLSARRD